MVADLSQPGLYTAHLSRGLENYSYSYVLYNFFGRYDPAGRLDGWVRNSSLDLQCYRMTADFTNLLRRCRFEGDPDIVAYSDRFWIAVYLKACDDGESIDELARRFRVIRAHVYAAVTLRLLPSETEYFTPIDYIHMEQYAGIAVSRRFLMFMRLGRPDGFVGWLV